MFPSKGTMDYSTEINRLFARNNENARHQYPSMYHPMQQNHYQTPIFHQTVTMANSSSSADSNSPASPPSLGNRSSPDTRRPETPQISRQRPIVGRKIMYTNEMRQNNEPQRNDFEFPIQNWRQFQVTAQDPFSNYELFPNDRGFLSPVKNEPKFRQENLTNYELFPTERKEWTPVKKQPNYSPRRISESSPPSFRQDISPTLVRYSPNYTLSESPTPSNFSQFIPRNQPNPIPFPTSEKLCSFCRKNGEMPQVYLTHRLKERVENRSIVICPILRNHRCDICGATGDNAHTKTYCPIQRSSNNGRPLTSTTVILKNTRVKSNGRRRY